MLHQKRELESDERFETISPILSDLICNHHGSPLTAYCHDCMLLVCADCLPAHETHYLNMMANMHKEFTKLSDSEKTNKLPSETIKTLSQQEHMYERRMNKLEVDILLDRSILNELNMMINNEKNTVEEEFKAINETILFVREQQTRSKTLVSKRCLQEMVEKIGSLDPQDIIRELKSYVLRKTEVESRTLANIWLYDYMCQKRMILSLIVALCGDNHSQHPAVVSSVAFLSHILRTCYEQPHAIGVNDPALFSAFPDVVEITELKRVQRLPCCEIEGGIQISQPIKIRGVTRREEGECVSISHTGLLCISKPKTPLYIYDMVGGEERVMEVMENTCSLGFYDDKVVLVENMKRLHEGETHKLLALSSVSCLSCIAHTPLVYKTCDVSLLNTTRTLVYGDWEGNTVCCFDVDSRKVSFIQSTSQMHSALSGTHVCGVRSVFLDKDSRVCALDGEWTPRVVDGAVGARVFGVKMVLPSCSEPNDISKALFLVEGRKRRCLIRNKPDVRSLTLNGSPVLGGGLARLAGDVFVAFDQARRRWSLVRLVVP